MIECPNCRARISFFRAFRTTAWGRFQCNDCSSVLAIDVKRRFLAVGLWLGVVYVLLEFFRVQDYGLAATIAVNVGTCLAMLCLFEKVVVIERRAFCCRRCGYSLQGLPTHRCPECGTPFDPAQQQRIAERIGSPPPKSKYRWVAVVLIVILTKAMVANLVAFRAARAKARRAPTTAPISMPIAPG